MKAARQALGAKLHRHRNRNRVHHHADRDRIVYNAATGQIFYDSDGSGAAAAILFATVTAGTALTSADFIAFG